MILFSANPLLETCYLEQKIPFLVGNPLHEDYPAVELALDIIHLRLRNNLRLRGLGYSFHLYPSAFNGVITLR